MSTAFALYTASWIVACLGAAAVAVVQRRRIELFDGAYWRFLARPWRLTYAMPFMAIIAATIIYFVATA